MINLCDLSPRRLASAVLVIGALSLGACSGTPEQRAQKHYERGASFLAAKDYVRARVEFRNALQRKNDMLAAWKGLAEIDEHDQNWQSLASSLRKIVELDDKDIESRLRLARIAIIARSTEEALKLTNSALDINGEHAGAIALRAGLLLRTNDTPAAMREAQRALALEPGNPDALIVLAAEKYSRGDFDGALQTLDQVKADRKEDLGVLTFKLMIFDRKQDKPQIESNLRRLVELHPKEAVFKSQLVRFFIANQRSEDAEKELRAIAAANPNNPKPKLDVVALLYTTKGPDAAREELNSLIKAGGKVFPFEMALVDLEVTQRKVDEAVRLLEKMIAGGNTPEDTIVARVKLAELHAGRREYDKAEALIGEVIRADSRNVNALRIRGAIKLEKGQIDEAIIDLRRALNDQPRSEQLMALLGVAFERQGSIELADKHFFDAMKASNFAPRTGLNYVSFLRRRGDIARAEEVLSEISGRRPNDLAVLSQLAEVRLVRQNWAGASEVAETIRRTGNNIGLADQIQGAVLAGQKKFEESISILESAQAASPDAVQPMLALVRAYIQAKQTDKAVAFLQSIVKANPNNAQALVLLGSTQLAANTPESALESFKLAIEKQPNNPIGYRALADYHLARRNPDEALKILQDGLKAQPGSFALRLVIAGIHELKGEYESAIQEYESLFKEQPGSLVVANNLASLLTDRRTDKESQERAFTVAMALNKTQVPQFKDTLGWIHHLRGDHKAAVTLLEDAATALPNVPYVRYHLAMTYIAMGQNDKAVEQLQKALELTKGEGELAEKLRAQLKNVQRG